MNMSWLSVLGISIWLLAGFSSYLWMRGRYGEYQGSEITAMFLLSVMGPVSWVMIFLVGIGDHEG